MLTNSTTQQTMGVIGSNSSNDATKDGDVETAETSLVHYTDVPLNFAGVREHYKRHQRGQVKKPELRKLKWIVMGNFKFLSCHQPTGG